MPDNPEAAAPPSAGRVYTHAERLRVIVGVLVCILLAALDQTAVLPAIPQMAASLKGVGHLSWVVSAYLLTTTATTPIYGKLSDQLGRRAVLVPALVFFLLASIMCALSTSVLMLIVARALQGVGGGALLAVSQSAVGDVVSPRDRGKYQPWFAGTWAFSAVAGPIAGGFLTQHLSWRWIFWLNLPLGLIALALCVRGLAGLKPAGLRSKIDYTGAFLLIVSVTAILLGLSSGGVDIPWFSRGELILLAIAIATSMVLFFQQRRAAAPLFPGVLLAHVAFRDILTISFLNSAALFGAIFLLPLMLQWLYHASPGASGFEIVPFLITSTLGSYLTGQVTRRTGRTRAMIISGVAVSTFGFAAMALAPDSSPIAGPIVISAIFGLGIGGVMPISLVAAQNHGGRRDIGTATGMLLLTRAMGGAFGATIAGLFLAMEHLDLPTRFHYGFAACAAMQAIAILVAFRMEDIRLHDKQETPQPAAAH